MTRKDFIDGLKDGIPIGAGYFAVAFSLGILAKRAGLNAIEGFFASLLNVASAGEYALFTSIASKASYFEISIATFIINARYFLMSCSLAQRIDTNTSFFHRFLVGYGVTDEIFGISVSRGTFLSPFYNYGAMLVAIPLWSIGTALGILAGNNLSERFVSALSVALYGMFIAIIIPPCKKNLVISGGVLSGFALSYLLSILPVVKEISSGTRTIILTVLISSICSIIRPVEEENENEE